MFISEKKLFEEKDQALIQPPCFMRTFFYVYRRAVDTICSFYTNSI